MWCDVLWMVINLDGSTGFLDSIHPSIFVPTSSYRHLSVKRRSKIDSILPFRSFIREFLSVSSLWRTQNSFSFCWNWAYHVSALEHMQAKFTDAGESKHEVFALTYYVSDSDDNEKERFFPVKRLQIYLANHGHLFGSRFNRGKFIFLITVASLLFQTGQSIKTRWQEFNKVNGSATSFFPCQQ